jgi:predicted Rossmann-fold nucleotide-binding protein
MLAPVKHTRGRIIEVSSLADLDARIDAGARSLSGWRVVGLDLTERGPVLLERSLGGTLFLGCRFLPDDEEQVVEGGAIVFPEVPGSPVNPYRARLYSADELYDAEDYGDSLDARAYAWTQGQARGDDLLARSLHDHAVDEALLRWVGGRSVVGVMGGHALLRGSAGYRDAARLSYSLGRHHTVATGGGPGAMEAANLGAWLAGGPTGALEAALTHLAAVPSFRPSVADWVRRAFDVIHRYGPGRDSLGIPTWHYGHEPPNPFASAIAKYFRNATREAILLEVCNAGIVFLPGAAGTVQEIFQDACENYYADASSVAPMILVGREHWTRTLPAWPLLQALARERDMAEHVHLVDSVDEVQALLPQPV